jgi:hypothetical protein
MSYNGSGTFNINSTGQPVVAGTVISSSAFNALTTDLATGLTTAITKDGQTTTTARITFAQGITSSLVTDSSSTSTGSIITAGGLGIAKNLYVGGIASFSAQPIFTSLTASSAVATDASKGLVSVTNTGTGNNVLATSPTLVTPVLGTPASGVMTNVTGINYDGYKNRIINGAMVIDQRNAGASITPTDGQYSVDRFQGRLNVAGKFTLQQNSGSVTPPAGYINYLGAVSTSAYTIGASETCLIVQAIEGLNVADLAWGTASAATVTLSFWVRSSLTGTFSGALQNSAGNRSYPYSYTISAANTWEQKTITIAGDTTGTWLTTNGIGISLRFNLGSGSTFLGTAGAWAASSLNGATGSVSVVGTNGATFYITGVQLEKGSTATSFDYRPYSSEFSMCQRYYQKCDSYSGAANTTTNYIGLFTLQQTMRTTPSIGQSGVVYISDYVASDIVQSSASTSVINTGGGGTAMVCYLFNYSGMTAGKFYASRLINSNYVTFSAEL